MSTTAESTIMLNNNSITGQIMKTTKTTLYTLISIILPVASLSIASVAIIPMPIIMTTLLITYILISKARSQQSDINDNELNKYEKLLNSISSDINRYVDMRKDLTKASKEDRRRVYDRIHNNMDIILDTNNADLIKQLHNTLRDILKNIPYKTRSDRHTRFIIGVEFIDYIDSRKTYGVY